MLTFESRFGERSDYNQTVKNGVPRYEDLLASTRGRERALFLPLRTPSELELQARWFAGDFGKNFVGATGDKIDIVQFGTWNRESGPDFSDAAISVNGSEPHAAASRSISSTGIAISTVTPLTPRSNKRGST